MTSPMNTDNTCIYYQLTDYQRKMAIKHSLGLSFPDKYIVTVPNFNASVRCSCDHFDAKLIPDRKNAISNVLIIDAEKCRISKYEDFFWSIALNFS